MGCPSWEITPTFHYVYMKLNNVGNKCLGGVPSIGFKYNQYYRGSALHGRHEMSGPMTQKGRRLYRGERVRGKTRVDPGL